MNEPLELTAIVQEFMAITSPAGNALRNQEAGVVAVLQEQLRAVRLDKVGTGSANEYETWLNWQTDELLRPVNARIRPWGTARKALNLFMRSCICDHHLRTSFGLDAIELWAEMPLDSVVATALKRAAGRGKLPEWPGLKHLDRSTSEQFQIVATVRARALGLPARIYLDYHLWLRNR